MSLHPEAIGEIPAETVRVARTVFPKGNIVMRLQRRVQVLSTRMRTSKGSTRPGGNPPWRHGDWL